MRRMFVVGVVLMALAAPAVAAAKVTRLPTAQRALLHHPPRPFTEVRAKSKLPPPVLALLGGAKNVADPGQQWQVSDVHLKELPNVLLDWAAISGDTYVIHYERGGIGHSYRVLVATWHPGDKEAKLLWFGVELDGPLANFQTFLAALDGDKLDDDARLIGP